MLIALIDICATGDDNTIFNGKCCGGIYNDPGMFWIESDFGTY